MRFTTTLSLCLSLCVASALVFAGCSGGGGGGGGAPATSAVGPTPTASPETFVASGTDSVLDAAGAQTPTAPASSAPISSSSAASSDSSTAAAVATQTFAGLRVATDFDFATMTPVEVAIRAQDADGFPAAERRVEIRDPQGGVLFRGRTDAAGELEVSLSVPTVHTYLRVELAVVGVASWQDVPLSRQIDVRFGA